MTLLRTLGGFWSVEFKGVTYYTFERDVSEAIAYALRMNGREVGY